MNHSAPVTPEEGKKLDQVRDILRGICQDHERSKHGGEACWHGRISLVAWVTHCLGVKAGDCVLLDKLPMMLDAYERDCPSCKAEKWAKGELQPRPHNPG